VAWERCSTCLRSEKGCNGSAQHLARFEYTRTLLFESVVRQTRYKNGYSSNLYVLPSSNRNVFLFLLSLHERVNVSSRIGSTVNESDRLPHLAQLAVGSNNMLKRTLQTKLDERKPGYRLYERSTRIQDRLAGNSIRTNNKCN
jgi:hypothetical protein